MLVSMFKRFAIRFFKVDITNEKVNILFCFRPDLRNETKIEVPKQINSLLFIETKNRIEKTDYCDLCDDYKHLCKITKADIDIFCTEKHNYIITWSPTKDILSGEVSVIYFVCAYF